MHQTAKATKLHTEKVICPSNHWEQRFKGRLEKQYSHPSKMRSLSLSLDYSDDHEDIKESTFQKLRIRFLKRKNQQRELDNVPTKETSRKRGIEVDHVQVSDVKSEKSEGHEKNHANDHVKCIVFEENMKAVQSEDGKMSGPEEDPEQEEEDPQVKKEDDKPENGILIVDQRRVKSSIKLFSPRIQIYYVCPIIVFAVAILMCLCSPVHCEQYGTEVTVALDGTGDYRTISDAINAMPSKSHERLIIRIMEGQYEEYVIVSEDKINIVLIGNGADKTIISGGKSDVGGFRTLYSATVDVKGDGFIAKYITFQNVAGSEMHQAVALANEARYTAFYKCRFFGFQDTLYVKDGIQFYGDCEVYGTIDFIFGNAAVVLQNCQIFVNKPQVGQKNTITASGRSRPYETNGIVLHQCHIRAAPDFLEYPEVRTFLGRPWGEYARTVIIESMLDALVDPEGWLQWEGKPTYNAFYAEFQNGGPGANTSQRVWWGNKTIGIAEARSYTVKNFLGGDTWIPSDIPYMLGLLSDQTSRVGRQDPILVLLLISLVVYLLFC